MQTSAAGAWLRPVGEDVLYQINGISNGDYTVAVCITGGLRIGCWTA
jgi:hypothetical protein